MSLVVKFHPLCCWVDSIGHTGETEHQTGEAGLNGVKALTTKKEIISPDIQFRSG
ncbi:MAG: hypothetical protein F6K23_28145 [Okeania sp. SIO2C9]|uniref:hypothetical protein n=1 Tax=Okeania sp. SIO2C9 TaxID=2607791 RepID=UPI0013BFDF86|nr:hypothetical protein [Okeania sp. SIO2C9]NEQ76564.1 hypothetical protein [Okeania sp. SIO2C9]